MHPSAKQLVLHGAIVLMIGLLCGAPYGRAINRGKPERTIVAWRVAHASLPIGAAVMLGVAGSLSALAIVDQIKWAVALSWIASSYAFCVSLPLAATTGHRGLTPGGPLSAWIVYGGNLTGAVLSFVGTALLIYAAVVSS